jgi:hypothetical protein
MRIAYLTTDEVNKELALRLAAERQVTVCCLEPRDPPPDGEFDAVLCDWDHWPADQRPKGLDDVPAAPVGPALALHGYGLGQDQARALRRRGVLLFQRLEPKTFLELKRAADQARTMRHEEETVDLGPPGESGLPAVTADQADKEPSWCQPGYTVKLHPPLPSLQPAGDAPGDPGLAGSPGFAANRRRKVYHNRCLRCQRQAEGMDYRFAVVQSPTSGYDTVNEEKAFICNRCAEARLRRSAWLVLLTWVPAGLLASCGWFLLALTVWLHGNPWRRAYLPTVGILFLLSFGLLVVTGLAFRLACRHLRLVTGKGYQHERFPDAGVTRMAIDLRKKEILSRLPLSASRVRFLIPSERWEVINPL